MEIYYPPKTMKSILFDIVRYAFLITVSAIISVYLIDRYIADTDLVYLDNKWALIAIWFSIFAILYLIDPIQNIRSFEKMERIERERRIKAREEERRQQAIIRQKNQEKEKAKRMYEKSMEDGELLQTIKGIPEEERTPFQWYELARILVGNSLYVVDENSPLLKHQFIFEGVDSLNSEIPSISTEIGDTTPG